MPPRKDHSGMQLSVCSVCFRKPKKTLRGISAKVKIQIQDAVMSSQSMILNLGVGCPLSSVELAACYKDLGDLQKNSKYVFYIFFVQTGLRLNLD